MAHNPSIFGEEDEFTRAFQQLTSEPPDDASVRLRLPQEQIDQLQEMCEELAPDQGWEQTVYECVRRVYVGQR